MKLWRNLIIMVAIVAILIGSFFVLKNIQSNHTDSDNTSQKDITLIKEDFDKVDYVTVTNGKNTMTYKTTDEDGVWQLKTTQKVIFALDSDQISSNGEILRKIQADAEIEKDPKDLKQYGLDTPKYTLTMALKDGTQTKLSIGDTSTTTGKTFAYYDHKVYTIYDYVVTAMKATIKDLEKTQTYQIPIDNIMALKIERKGQPTIDIAMRNDNKNSYETHTSKLQMNSPYANCDVNDENMKTMVYTYLNQIAFTKELEIDSADYAAYGVQDPQTKFTIRYYDSTTGDSVTKVLSVSALKDGYYYAKFDDYAKMYRFPKEAFDFVDNIDPYRAVSQVGFIYNIDVVNKIVVQTNGETYTFDITHKKVSDTETEANFTFNGKKVNTDPALSMYQQLIGFYREGVYNAPKEPTANPDFSMTFTLGNHTEKTLQFKPINEREYSYTVDGQTKFIIKKSTVQKVMDALKNYEKDPSKTVVLN